MINTKKVQGSSTVGAVTKGVETIFDRIGLVNTQNTKGLLITLSVVNTKTEKGEVEGRN